MSTELIVATSLPGVYLLPTPAFQDERGLFVKPFNDKAFEGFGLSFPVGEHFITRSAAGVLRGMHFQVGRSAHAKLVTCISGRILDVIVDVRPDSPGFNQPFSIELFPLCGYSVYIEKGYAHGFLALEDHSWVGYLTTKGHSPADDKGVLWSSIDFHWPIEKPIVSKRDWSHSVIGEEVCEFF